MLIDTLRQLAGVRVLGPRGREEALELLPPATESELRNVEAALPAPLPDEIRAALQYSKGLANGPFEAFSLIDLEGFGLEELFPQSPHRTDLGHHAGGGEARLLSTNLRPVTVGGAAGVRPRRGA
jgi:hypothetical protein